MNYEIPGWGGLEATPQARCSGSPAHGNPPCRKAVKGELGGEQEEESDENAADDVAWPVGGEHDAADTDADDTDGGDDRGDERGGAPAGERVDGRREHAKRDDGLDGVAARERVEGRTGERTG
jgi:hypothetical protein